MSLNAPYTPNTVIQSTQVSNDLVGLANGTNDTTNNSMSTYRSDVVFDHVASGCVWSGDAYASTRNASQTSGVVYIGGVRLTVAAVSARSFTASVDTYIDVNGSGVQVYTEVSNNAASPALTAGNIRIGIIVTGATTIAAATSVNQGQESRILPIASSIAYAVTDSLGNLICPRDPNRKILGSRQITATFGTTTTAAFVDVTGVNVPFIVPTGRKIRAVVTAPFAKSTQAAGNAVYVSVNDATAAAEVGQAHFDTPVASYSENTSFNTPPITPPASGSRTYKLQIKQDAAGTVSLFSSVTSPVALTIELI